jgi:hypothetical protein
MAARTRCFASLRAAAAWRRACFAAAVSRRSLAHEAGYLALVRNFSRHVDGSERALAWPADHKDLAFDDSKRRNGEVGLQLVGAVGAWDYILKFGAGRQSLAEPRRTELRWLRCVRW